jgi:hypothetical protein
MRRPRTPLEAEIDVACGIPESAYDDRERGPEGPFWVTQSDVVVEQTGPARLIDGLMKVDCNRLATGGFHGTLRLDRLRPATAEQIKRAKTTRGKNPVRVNNRQIRQLHAEAVESGDLSLMTLCEISLGGRGALNQVARTAVEAHLEKQRKMN